MHVSTGFEAQTSHTGPCVSKLRGKAVKLTRVAQSLEGCPRDHRLLWARVAGSAALLHDDFTIHPYMTHCIQGKNPPVEEGENPTFPTRLLS